MPMVTESDMLAYYDAHESEIDRDILDTCDELFDLPTSMDHEDIPDEYFIQAACMHYLRRKGCLA